MQLPGIFAAGDVAFWLYPFTKLRERHEYWTVARQQGRIVAQSICGKITTSWRAFVPYFWSDLHGVRPQTLRGVRLSRSFTRPENSSGPSGVMRAREPSGMERSFCPPH